MSGGFKGGSWNVSQRGRRFVIESAPITKSDAEKLIFFSKLEQIARENNIPYIEVLIKARDDGFFDATDEVIREMANDHR